MKVTVGTRRTGTISSSIVEDAFSYIAKQNNSKTQLTKIKLDNDKGNLLPCESYKF